MNFKTTNNYSRLEIVDLLLLLASVVLTFVRRSAPGGGSWSSSLSILVAQPVEVVDLSLFLVDQLQHNQTGY